MKFSTALFLFFAVAGVLFFYAFQKAKKEQERINSMSPGARSNYIFGPVNDNLICPHCQTKSTVRVKQVARNAVSTGTVGGILKSNTTSTVTTVATQHHCDHCGSTWDI